MEKVTIVGGGVIGLTTAVVLEKYPNPKKYDITVVEKAEEVGSKSTSAAGCGLRTLYRNRTNLELSKRGIRFWSNAEQLLGQEIGFRRNGYLFLTDDKETSKVLNRQSKEQYINGIPTIRNPSTYPAISEINHNKYKSSLLLPESALASPEKIVQALKNEAQSNDISINTGEEVTDIERLENRTKVITDEQSYNSNHVVNASGAWSNNIASMVNVNLPIRNTRRRLSLLDKKVHSNMPLTVDIDTGVYLLPNENGQLMAGGNILNGNNNYDEHHPESFSESHSKKWNNHFRSLSNRIRGDLTDVEIKESWTGLYTMTESRVPIIEEENDVVHVCGFSGHGIMHAPGAASIVAQKINNDYHSELPSLSTTNRPSKTDIQF